MHRWWRSFINVGGENVDMKIAVIGSGTMGNGIAHSFASNGYKVILNDINRKFLDNGIVTIEQNLNRFLNKGKINSEDVESTLNNIQSTTNIQDISNVDLVVEAATEDFKIKSTLFTSLDKITHPHCILASNTSSISINKIADCTQRAQNVIGMHFMNPVPIMKLVEVIKTNRTSSETLDKIIDVSKSLGKKPVECLDSPGFVSNRILMPMINEAIYTLMEGIATPEAIDEIMKLGMSHPMGPLQLADLIGLDVCLSIMNVLKDGFKDDPKYEPCPLLVKLCKENKLGRKTGEGFYKY